MLGDDIFLQQNKAMTGGSERISLFPQGMYCKEFINSKEENDNSYRLFAVAGERESAHRLSSSEILRSCTGHRALGTVHSSVFIIFL